MDLAANTPGEAFSKPKWLFLLPLSLFKDKRNIFLTGGFFCIIYPSND